MKRKRFLSSSDKKCEIAEEFFPKDGQCDCVPVHTIGDGSCFPRALSHAVFGTQEHHRELRIRLIYEAVTNSSLYLNSNYLRLGTSIQDNAAGAFALYTGDETITTVRMTRAQIFNVYKNDVMRISNPVATWESGNSIKPRKSDWLNWLNWLCSPTCTR